ncbi:hypothetical protein ACTFIU_001674 [Dictyostelium citrinum]
MVDFTHLKSNDSNTKNILFGNLCFLGNTLAYAIFLLSQKPLIDDGGMSASKCMAWSFTIGTPPVIGIALIIAKSEVSSQVASISLFSWLAIIYCAIFATAYAFFASSWAVAKSDSTTVSVYLTVEPLLTGVLAYIFLDELLTPLNIVGGIVILVGVGAVMVSKYREGKKDTLYKYEKQKLNAEKQYNINNGSIELPQFIDSTFDNNNNKNINNINNINNTSNGDIISNSISHSSSENSFSKIIVSTSIISQPDDNNNNNNKNYNNFINNNNDNNSNNTINNIINIRNSYDDNLDNSKNNLLSIFKKQSIISDDDDDDDDNNGGKDEYDLDISKSGDDSLRAGGAVLVF